MAAYGFVVMGIGDRYVGYFGDNPVGSPPRQAMRTLRDDMLRASMEFFGDEMQEGIPVETRYPYRPQEYLYARKLGEGEMKMLLSALNENGDGITFYQKEVEKEVFYTNEPKPVEAKKHRMGGRTL
jgi:hypothetical protein